MKLAVIAANGQAGKAIVEEAVKRGKQLLKKQSSGESNC